MTDTLNALLVAHHDAAWIGFAAIWLLILVLLIALFVRDRRRSHHSKIPPPPIVRDWLATGRINAVADAEAMERADDVGAEFVLLVEENRLVEDISGLPNVEIRWRHPTRQEVREVVRRYHEKIELHPQADKMTRSAFDTRAPLELVAQAAHSI
jgi:hypothetical protein